MSTSMPHLDQVDGPPVESQCRDGLRSLLEQRSYSVLLLDQVGVLHDGVQGFPDAIQCLRQLKATHGSAVRVVILSNASAGGEVVLASLGKKGFPRDCFDHAVTSGGVAEKWLRNEGFVRQMGGPRCVHLNWDFLHDACPNQMEEWGLIPTETPADANFILLQGLNMINGRRATREAMLELLQACAPHKLPMVCVNPDRYAVKAGKLEAVQGELAEKYVEMGGGGVVHWMGKPCGVMYDEALRVAGVTDDTKRDVLCVGDSLQHDVLGAAAHGMDSCFIASGVDAVELGLRTAAATDEGTSVDYQMPTPDALHAVCKSRGAPSPVYTMPHFKW